MTNGGSGSAGPAERYPPLSDYGLIGDRRSAALVSTTGSIDWCCMPRFDGEAVFARLLDWEDGGHCSIEARGARSRHRRYLDETLVLETRLETDDAEARILDFFATPGEDAAPRIVRIVEGCRGSLELAVCVAPRFDYGQVAPWMRGDDGLFAAIGGDDGLLIRSDMGLEVRDRHRLEGEISIGEGQRLHLELGFRAPVELDSLEGFEPLDPGELDACLQETRSWWDKWRGCIDEQVAEGLEGAIRSALVLKALNFEPTGAIAAAATTSLPEARDLSGERNWDYRFSWIRDSALAVRSLAELGCDDDADAFRRFIERSAAGHAADLQVVYGVGGERRLREADVENLEGYCGAGPVTIGNGATQQLQLDAFGQLVDQSWRWHCRGNSPDRDYWTFVADLVEAAVDHWQDPDRGIWEWREEPRHFVHSKAFAWAAVDRGLRLADDIGADAPSRWAEAREEIATTIEARGYDQERGIFVQAFDYEDLDAALLRLPTTGFIDWEDERMVRTTDAIRERLGFGGLLRRYDADDGMPEEGAFLACSFWLATCLARQGRSDEAREAFELAVECSNDLGLFAEQYDPERHRMLGNFPQALTHLSHIEAALAVAGRDGDDRASPGG